jgi:hypothetical protein
MTELVMLVIGMILGGTIMWWYLSTKDAPTPIQEPEPVPALPRLQPEPVLDINPIGNTQAHITRWEIKYQMDGQDSVMIFPTIMNQMPHEERHAFHKHMAAEAARWKLGASHEYINLA